MGRFPQLTGRVRHLVAGGLLAVGAAVAIGWTIGYVVAPLLWQGDRLRDGDAAFAVAAPERAPDARRAIDGLPSASDAPERLVALMVENHEDARPLSGIARASLVFEAPVEGGITRLLAVYPESAEVGEIGPVRSARPYYLDWAGELDALYGHVGGSPEALARIKAGAVRDLDQYWNGQYYWRSTDRTAPHNVYTSTPLLRRALAAAADGATPLAPWRFADEVPAGWTGDAADVAVPFSTPAYAVRWRYDAATGLYVRSVGGSAAVDADGAPERAANVAVIFVEREILDAVGRLRLGTVGSGRGILIRDGKAYDGVWRKDAARDRLGLFLADGEEVVWKPGPTWVEAVPTGTEVAIGPAAAPDQLVLPYSP